MCEYKNRKIGDEDILEFIEFLDSPIKDYILKGLERCEGLTLRERNRFIKDSVEEMFGVVLDKKFEEGIPEQLYSRIWDKFEQFIDAYFHNKLPVDGLPNQLNFWQPSPEEIQRGLDDLIAGESEGLFGGFVVFEVESGFVQYTLRPNGFLLDWPTENLVNLTHLSVVQQELEKIGIQKLLTVPVDIGENEICDWLPKGFMAQTDISFIAQLGKNVSLVKDFSLLLLKKIRRDRANRGT